MIIKKVQSVRQLSSLSLPYESRCGDIICFLTHSLNEEFEEINESLVFSDNPEQIFS